MPFFHTVFRLIDKVFPAQLAYAHCDIPCGIYDPHGAQMAGHTVIRMVNLIGETVASMKNNQNPTIEERRDFIHKLSRYGKVKEEHVELCKHEIRILWGDYFKPEDVEKYPELHELVWKVMKLGSKARQEVNLQVAEELLETVNKVAEIFWKTNGMETTRIKATFYPTGRETVYPKVK